MVSEGLAMDGLHAAFCLYRLSHVYPIARGEGRMRRLNMLLMSDALSKADIASPFVRIGSCIRISGMFIWSKSAGRMP